jgi:hypothetical protein
MHINIDVNNCSEKYTEKTLWRRKHRLLGCSREQTERERPLNGKIIFQMVFTN